MKSNKKNKAKNLRKTLLLIASIVLFFVLVVIVVINVVLVPIVRHFEKVEDYCWKVTNEYTRGKEEILEPTAEEKKQFPGISKISNWLRIESRCEREGWFYSHTKPLTK